MATTFSVSHLFVVMYISRSMDVYILAVGAEVKAMVFAPIMCLYGGSNVSFDYFLLA